jgi:hypothetical protein
MLGGFLRVMRGVCVVAVGCVRVMCRWFVPSSLVMVGGLMMVLGGLCVMFGRLAVMFRSILRHLRVLSAMLITLRMR